MIDAVRVEVLRHGAQSLPPPRVVVLGHHLPVVRREAPILARHSKSVGRRASLEVHVVQLGLRPRVYAAAVDADWQVAFEHHAVVARVRGGSVELQVEVVLNERIVDALLVVGIVDIGVHRLHNVAIVVALCLWPLQPVGALEAIAQAAESRVVVQPVRVVAHVRSERRVLLQHCSGTERVEQTLRIPPFELHHTLVVDLIERLQLGHLTEVLLLIGHVGQLAHLRQIQVLRVQREH
mmetsp:Transcript_37173/g.91125  ORF Transcript_37173/g.91125 Transcript_37173/m.91125 type:complete len:237 (-) Transcript_37173:85-795(-)